MVFAQLSDARFFGLPGVRDRPRGSQDRPKIGQKGVKTTQESPMTAQEAPRWPQENPKTAQDGPKTPPQTLQIGTRPLRETANGSKMAPRSLRRPPQDVQEASRGSQQAPRSLRGPPRTLSRRGLCKKNEDGEGFTGSGENEEEEKERGTKRQPKGWMKTPTKMSLVTTPNQVTTRKKRSTRMPRPQAERIRGNCCKKRGA